MGKTLGDVFIAGVGMTWFGGRRDATVKSLTREAVTAALADAGAAVHDVAAAVFGNVSQGQADGQHSIRGQVALRSAGLTGIPITNVENACATGGTALHHAVNLVRAGHDVVLAVGAEQLTTDDRDATLSRFSGGYDVRDPFAIQRLLRDVGGPSRGRGDGERGVFVDIYAAVARAHMTRYGTTAEQLALISAKNHRHAVDNPRAHHSKELTVEEILAARAPVRPLTIPMCAPLTDGAAAVLVCSAAGLARLPDARPVRVLACELGSGATRAWDDWAEHVVARVSTAAYERAGIGPADVSVAEVHDATAFGELLNSELLGFCETGAGGELAESGATALGGRVPLNPSGGLESRGHPPGATGLAQVFELVEQLRQAAGERQVPGARYGLAENGGGFLGNEEAAVVVTILGR